LRESSRFSACKTNRENEEGSSSQLEIEREREKERKRERGRIPQSSCQLMFNSVAWFFFFFRSNGSLGDKTAQEHNSVRMDRVGCQIQESVLIILQNF
jgi:hypothetical protein